MKAVKKTAAVAAACIAVTAAMPYPSYADDPHTELIPETGDTLVTIPFSDGGTLISPYIYGVNDIYDLSGSSPTVIKQKGTAFSTYNWETNYSNSGAEGSDSNDFSLVEEYSPANWSIPALAVYSLDAKAKRYDIPMRLVTLPMMGYVARDSMGIVSDDELSRNTRWCRISFDKEGAYLTQPDISDDTVYIDEYVSYLVNRYGTAGDGGINGYFLDSEPDKWAERFSVIRPEKLSPMELIDISEALSSAVKSIDGQALVFGPSLGSLQACINLDDPDAWNELSAEGYDYSWFMDCYLDQMRQRSEQRGERLLDVLDVHYYTEAMTPLGVSILTGTDEYSNAYRMQAVNTLWDPDYTENSVTVLMNKQYTPVIPTLKASVSINYPDTRLSFSEYDFGGGGHISGAAAEADALGIFAREGVYLACLSPVSENCDFQKAAVSLYTNYDGKGAGFGDILLDSDNGSDSMSSVYASADSAYVGKLKTVLINKNTVNKKKFTLDIHADGHFYNVTRAFCIDSSTAQIVPVEEDAFEISEDGLISFEAEPYGVYMLELDWDEDVETNENTEENVWVTQTEEEISEDIPDYTETVMSESETTATVTETEHEFVPTADTSLSESETEYLSDTQTAESVSEMYTSEIPWEEDTSVSEEEVPAAVQTQITGSEESETETVIEPESEKAAVAAPIKVIVSILAAAVGLGVVYILIIDRK